MFENNKERLFVVAAEVIKSNGFNTFPSRCAVGIEMANSFDGARLHARKRWPGSVLYIAPWEKVEPKVRLAAIEADQGYPLEKEDRRI